MKRRLPASTKTRKAGEESRESIYGAVDDVVARALEVESFEQRVVSKATNAWGRDGCGQKASNQRER